MRELDPFILGRVFYRNLIFIIPVAILGIFAGNYVNYTTTPIFRSSADLFISTPASAIDIGLLATGSTFSQERVKSYTQIINAPATLQPVIDKLELNTTPEALAMRITASAPADTVVIRLTVVDENPTRAAAIANEVGSQFALTAESIELTQLDLTSPVKVSVARPAVPEYSPISPKKKTNQLLGFTFFGLICYGLFLLRHLLDTTVKNVSDLRGVPLLAAIGFDPTADKKPLISEIGSYDARYEAYRTLRTNLLTATKGEFPKSISIVSGMAEEGKSSTAINLAISLANQGIKCLLIEGDLRRPRFKQYLNLNEKQISISELGLTDVLQCNSVPDFKKALLRSLNTAYENVDFIHSGKIVPNPTELLSATQFSDLLAEAKKRYQMVLIDCPPVLPVTDAVVISQVVDGIIIITYGGRTKSKSYMATLDLLEIIKTKIYGVVINKIPNGRESEDYGYLSGYSKYYKRRYDYFLRNKGYTPYGPYNPSNEADTSSKAVEARNPKIPVSSNPLGKRVPQGKAFFLARKKIGRMNLEEGQSTSAEVELAKILEKIDKESKPKFPPTKNVPRKK